jgi:hypothetical protein
VVFGGELGEQLVQKDKLPAARHERVYGGGGFCSGEGASARGELGGVRHLGQRAEHLQRGVYTHEEEVIFYFFLKYQEAGETSKKKRGGYVRILGAGS